MGTVRSKGSCYTLPVSKRCEGMIYHNYPPLRAFATSRLRVNF